MYHTLNNKRCSGTFFPRSEQLIHAIATHPKFVYINYIIIKYNFQQNFPKLNSFITYYSFQYHQTAYANA